jgi:hypothetical protein
MGRALACSGCDRSVEDPTSSEKTPDEEHLHIGPVRSNSADLIGALGFSPRSRQSAKSRSVKDQEPLIRARLLDRR